MEKIFKSENVVVLLVVIALGLGASLYLKNKPPQDSKVSVSENQAVNSTTVEMDKNLTEEQKILFYNPPQGAPKEEFDKFFGQVYKSAVEGNKIVVKDCIATPLVLKMPYGETLTVENQGPKDMDFGFNDERTLVKVGTSEKIKTNYKNGNGIYGYGCGNNEVARSIGVLLLTKVE